MANNFKKALVEVKTLRKKLKDFDLNRCYITLLLNNVSYKYSKFNNNRKKYASAIQNTAGVYHFYIIENDRKKSLYVGKGGFEQTGKKWDLYKRLIQHFQPSQSNTLHGKIANELGIANLFAINNVLMVEEIYLQWISIFKKLNNGKYLNNITKEIFCDKTIVNDYVTEKEQFIIKILKPKWSN